MGANYQFGILFMDSIQQKYDETTKTKFREMITEGTELVENEYIIEDLIFIDSKYRAISQLVDCIAYVMRRYFRLLSSEHANNAELLFYSDCVDIIRPHIRNFYNHISYDSGLKIYP